jgi:ribosomal-protein-alanine N-acetyltransferase
VRLRSAAPVDAKFLAVIEDEASSYPWSDAQLAAACGVDVPPGQSAHSERVLVVEQDREICGFIVYTQLLDEGTIHNIAVRPACQRRGMARALLAEVLDVLALDGANRALLEVRVSNTAAQRLYDSFGFELDGVRKNYYPSHGAREDALLMSKPLIIGE